MTCIDQDYKIIERPPEFYPDIPNWEEQDLGTEYLAIANEILCNSGLPLEQPPITREEIDLQKEAYGLENATQPDLVHREEYLRYLEEIYIQANCQSQIETIQLSQSIPYQVESAGTNPCAFSASQIVSRMEFSHSQTEADIAKQQIEEFRAEIRPLMEKLGYFRKEISRIIMKEVKTGFMDKKRVTLFYQEYKNYLASNPDISEAREALIYRDLDAELASELITKEDYETLKDRGPVFAKLTPEQVENLIRQDEKLWLLRFTKEGQERWLRMSLGALIEEARSEIHLTFTHSTEQSTEEKVREIISGSGLNHRTLLVLTQAITRATKIRRNGKVMTSFFESKDPRRLQKAAEELIRCSVGNILEELTQEGYDSTNPAHAMAHLVGGLEAIESHLVRRSQITSIDLGAAISRYSPNGISYAARTQVLEVLNELASLTREDRETIYSYLINGRKNAWSSRDILIEERKGKSEQDSNEVITAEQLIIMGEHMMLLIQNVFSEETIEELGLAEVPKGRIEEIKRWCRNQKTNSTLILEGHYSQIEASTEILVRDLAQNFELQIELLNQLMRQSDLSMREGMAPLISIASDLLKHPKLFEYLEGLVGKKAGSEAYLAEIKRLKQREGSLESQKNSITGGDSTKKAGRERRKPYFYDIPQGTIEQFSAVVESGQTGIMPRELALRELKLWLDDFEPTLQMGAYFGELLEICLKSERCILKKPDLPRGSTIVTNNTALKRVLGVSFRVQDYDQVTAGRRGTGSKNYVLNEDFFSQWVNWLNQENKLKMSPSQIKDFAEGLALHFEI